MHSYWFDRTKASFADPHAGDTINQVRNLGAHGVFECSLISTFEHVRHRHHV